MKLPSSILFFALLVLLVAACDTTGPKEKPDEPDDPKELFPAPVNEDISLLRSCCDNPFNEGPPAFGVGDYYLNEWTSGGKIFTSPSLRILDISITPIYGSIQLDGDTLIIPPVEDQSKVGPPINFTYSQMEQIIYNISSYQRIYSDGELRSYNLQTKEYKVVRDSTYHISSIRVREKPDGSFLKVYYSYGNEDTGLQAGYYRLRESGPPDELLLAHTNPNGPTEVMNGFDVSPDGSTLLYPIHHAYVPGYAYGGPPPELATLNLETGATDTLPVAFNHQQFLWARYHPSGDSLVVSNYARYVLANTPVDDDSMYTVDLSDYSRRSLDSRTWRGGYTTDVFPSWSPHGRYLIYGSGKVSLIHNSIGRYSVFIMDMEN